MVKLDFSVFPILESPRFTLRALSTDDADEMFLLRSDPDLMKYIPRPLATSLEDIHQHIEMMTEMVRKNEGIIWAITYRENTNLLLGTIGLYRINVENSRAEVGYMLLKEYQNKGVISETMDIVLGYAFKHLNFHSIQAVIDPSNIASENVLIKSKFKKEAHLREYEYFDGRYWDSVIYSILKRECIMM